jgi:hypothetical protein
LPVVLYGCENEPVTLREERGLRVFEIGLLREEAEVAAEWRRLHNEELHGVYSGDEIKDDEMAGARDTHEVVKCLHAFEICVLVRCYAALSSSSVQTFRDNLSVPSSRVKALVFLTLEEGTDRLSRNVCTELLLNSALHPRRAQISSASRLKPEIMHRTGFCLGNSKEKDQLENLGVDGV